MIRIVDRRLDSKNKSSVNRSRFITAKKIFFKIYEAGAGGQRQHGGAGGQPFPRPGAGTGYGGKRIRTASLEESVRGAGESPPGQRGLPVRAWSGQPGEQRVGFQFRGLPQEILLGHAQHGEQAQVLAQRRGLGKL